MDQKSQKAKLARFGRSLALLLNRGMMYQKSHPMVRDSVIEVHKAVELILSQSTPVVFILNRDQFYVDEEQLDPRINVKRIAASFESHGIQSISFEQGLTTGELDVFIEIFSALTIAMDAEAIKKALFTKGAYHIKVNHVLYKKVTEDDQIISREALKDVTPDLDDGDEQGRKRFMDTLMESVLSEEFANSLNIQSLLSNPSAVSKSMIEADLANASRTLLRGQEGTSDTGMRTDASGSQGASGPGGAAAGGEAADGTPFGAVSPGGAIGGRQAGAGGQGSTQQAQTDGEGPSRPGGAGHGPMLLHQLDLMRQEIEKHLEGGGEFSLQDLAKAIFDMKKQLFEGLETQKALGVAYENESSIINNVNELTELEPRDPVTGYTEMKALLCRIKKAE